MGARLWLSGFFWAVLLAVVTCAACGGGSTPPVDGPAATLVLASPEAPLGLSYGEAVTLVLRYRQHDRPQAGVTLQLLTDGNAGGATLSTSSVVTNERGEASALLMSGASESAFHIVVSAPLAPDLVIDVAVSRYAFGSMAVDVDGTPYPGATAVRAGLFTDMDCTLLPPTPKLLGALRSLSRPERRGLILFTTLLRRSYSVVGRAEDASGHLRAYGCVLVSEQILSAGVPVPVTVPMRPIYPDPVGSYSLRSELRPSSDATAPWAMMACPNGLGQVMVDAVVAALPMAERDLVTRINGARATIDAQGCRLAALDDPDHATQAVLIGSPAGSTLVPVAAETNTILGSTVLSSRLDVRGATSGGFLADHAVGSITLATPMTPVTYALNDVFAPIARDLLVVQTAEQLALPKHGLSVQLPRLWRRAQQDLVLQPRRVMVTPTQLWQQAVAAARQGMLSGCDAVEAAICSRLAQPCKGPVATACALATSAVGTKLSASLEDAIAAIDLSYRATVTLDDPEGTLQAKSLSMGQLADTSTIELRAGAAPLTGSVTGTRLP
jgi:hypothetical protein